MLKHRLLLKHALALPYPPPKYQAIGNENMKLKPVEVKEGRAQPFPGEKSVLRHRVAHRMLVSQEAAPAQAQLPTAAAAASIGAQTWLGPSVMAMGR